MNLAYEYALINGQKGFSKLTKQAGHAWLQNFLKRFPEVHIKKGQNLSIIRAVCPNKLTVNKYFVIYQHLLNIFNIENPMNIWNCNESGVQDVPKEDVIGVMGEKVHTMSPKEQGKSTKVLTFANACGQVFPPLVIFKGAKVNDAWVANAPSNIPVKASPKGRINKDVFLDILLRGSSG